MNYLVLVMTQDEKIVCSVSECTKLSNLYLKDVAMTIVLHSGIPGH